MLNERVDKKTRDEIENFKLLMIFIALGGFFLWILGFFLLFFFLVILI